MYMHDIDVIKNGNVVGPQSHYVIPTVKNPRHDEPPLTTHDFIHEQANKSYCQQPSFRLGVPESEYIQVWKRI